MYKKQTNKTAQQSQRLIADALFRLMDRQPFGAITVTQICEEAGVGRKTFYRNFELKEDVIDFRLDELCGVYEKGLMGIALEQRLGYHFRFLQHHTDELICLYRNGLSSMVDVKFSVFRPMTMPVWSEDPVEQQYRSEYVAAGIDAIVRTWVSRGFRESLDEIIAIAARAQGIYQPAQP